MAQEEKEKCRKLNFLISVMRLISRGIVTDGIKGNFDTGKATSVDQK